MSAGGQDSFFPPESDEHTELSDGDSGYPDSDALSATTSIASEFKVYPCENGRTYHSFRAGSYLLPNDENEKARLDLLHHITKEALGGRLCLEQPDLQELAVPFRVLDIGTGTGIWAIEFAEEFPRADVFGNDLSPIQPIWVPTNVKFVVDDAEDDWNYTPEERFHFIHGRGLGGCIADWPRLLGRILDDLHPGGVCEMHEFGWIETVAGETLGESLQMWIELVSKGFLKLGKTLDIGLALEELMENAGFINVKVKRVKVPIGAWAKNNKKIGICQLFQILDCVDSFTPAPLTRFLDWTSDECEVLMAKVRAELQDRARHMFTTFWFVRGEKPTGTSLGH